MQNGRVLKSGPFEILHYILDFDFCNLHHSPLFSAFQSASRIGPNCPVIIFGTLDHDSLMRWSVMRSCGKLSVRTFSLRSPVPTCDLRSAARSRASRSSCSCWMRLTSSFIAFSLFWACERSEVHFTSMPVGLWMIRTAVSTLFTFCPPAPPERDVSTSRSAGLISILVLL